MPDRNARGFTLVELAVIVAIVGFVQVLAIYPMGERAREESRKSTCQNNLYRLGLSLAMYYGDYDATLPSSAVTANPPGSTPTETQVINFLTGTGSRHRPLEYGTIPTTWPEALSPFMKDQTQIFCPSDSPRTRVSYWWKYSIDLAWRNNLARKDGDYDYPQRQIFLYEHSAWHSFNAAGIKNGVSINAVYMDGHAGLLTVRNGPSSYPSAVDERTGASAIRLGSPMYYNYDNTTSAWHSGVADYVDPHRYSDGP